MSKKVAKVPESGQARAVARHLRYSARKGRLVADMIRGKRVDTAVAILQSSKKTAAAVTLKVLRSAMANAADNKNMNVDQLYIKSIFVDEGRTMKRWMPRARGRADRICKRMCHTTVVLAERA